MAKEKGIIMDLEAGPVDDCEIIEASDGSAIYSEEHLLNACERVPMFSELCIHSSNTDQGRSIKLTQYIDLSLKYLNSYPPDWHLFVRTATNLPIAKRTELLKKLEDEQGWEIDWKKKRIKEGPIRGYDPLFKPTNLKRLMIGEK